MAGLLGRSIELEALRATLDRAMAGQPAFVLLLGEPGIGKTRLLAAVAEEATARGFRPLVGTAIESGMALPYLPLIAALPEAFVRSATREAASTDPEPDPADAASAARMVEAIHDAVVRVPSVLLLDDIQWADASTLTVLDYLAHRARDSRLAVVVAARDEPAALARLSIADGRRYRPIRVGRLGRDDVAGQILALSGATPVPAFVERIYRRTDGNPFFVEQLVASQGGSSEAGPLPASLRLLVVRRVGRLAEPTRRVLAALAVIGRPADPAELSAVAAASRTAVDEALAEAVAQGVVVIDPGGIDLRHPIFAEVIAGGLERTERAALHGRAATAMETLGRPVAEIAEHWWEADDPAKAWASALAAGDAAERSSAFAETRVHLERALQSWPAAAAGRNEVTLRAARAAWISGDAAAALALVTTLPEDAQGSLDALVAAGAYAWDAGDRATGARVFERLHALTTDSSAPSIRGKALWGLGRARIANGRAAEAADLAAAAASFAAEAGDLADESEAWALHGMSLAFQGGTSGIPALERAVELGLASGAPSQIGHSHQFLVDLLGLSGDVDRALKVARVGIEACDRLGLGGSHGSDLRGRAALLWIALGDWPAADAVLEGADPRAFPALARGLLATRRGAFESAEASLAAAAAGGSIGGPGALGGWLELANAELAWACGDVPEALRNVAAMPPVGGVWGFDIRARAAWWEAWLAPDPEQTEPRSAATAANPDPLLAAALTAGVAAGATSADSSAGWAASADAWGRARHPHERAHARLREAEARFASGDRGVARTALQDAAEMAAQLGAEPLQRLVDDLARRARVAATPTRRSAPDPSALTARETEVLELLADGLTNPQIADRLFLSRKTVGIHVSRILDKLGAHTRGEAVAAGRRGGLLRKS